jgi:catechol 2,3-dioxygenase-like lactoylglutathione lyase family enzyme
VLDTAHLVAFVATTQPERSRAFYRGVLGLRLVSEDAFAIVFDANGTMLRVSKAPEFEPLPFTVLGWGVTDLGAVVAELGRRGVSFERFAGMPQDENGIWAAPGGARVAWFKDPDGNLLSVAQG